MGNQSFFAPENFTEGGGLLDDVNVEFKKVRVVLWDYNGSVPVASPALQVEMAVEDAPEGEDPNYTQYYSIGKPTLWQPSADGTELIAVGKEKGLARSSNAAVLMASLIEAGFPDDRINNKVTWMEGLRAHMSRIPAPERKGLSKSPRVDGRTYDATVLIVKEILELPGEGAAAAAATTATTGKKGGGKGKATAPAPAAGASDIDETCTGLLIAVLAQAGAPLPQSMIPTKVYQMVEKDPNKNLIIQRIFDTAFLEAGATSGKWKFENGQVSLG